MYGYESWSIKKAECQRMMLFNCGVQLWYWRRCLKVHWAARRSNQSILKEINSEFSLEGLMLKLKLQYFGHLMRRADSLEKIGILGKVEGRRRRGRQRMRWLISSFTCFPWTWVWVSSRRWQWTGKSCAWLFSTPWTTARPVFHYFPWFAQTHVHWVSDTIQLSHALLPPSPPAFTLVPACLF